MSFFRNLVLVLLALTLSFASTAHGAACTEQNILDLRKITGDDFVSGCGPVMNGTSGDNFFDKVCRDNKCMKFMDKVRSLSFDCDFSGNSMQNVARGLIMRCKEFGIQSGASSVAVGTTFLVALAAWLLAM